MKNPFLSVTKLFGELKRRKVYPVIVTYAITGWILLQIGEVTFEPLGAPDWLMTSLVVLVMAGFPVALILAWVFDITPNGPVRDSSLHLVQNDTADTEQITERQQDPDNSPSIAVLPFSDMSPDQDQGYFCEGVAEEILNSLTKIRELHVAARMSSFQYQVGWGDAREIGEKLGVKTILEGSVRKAGDKIRVTAQLITVANGYHIWSKTYDQELKDIFAIQDEIANSIAGALLDMLVAPKTASSQDVLAYEYYLRGRHFFHRFRKKDIHFARKLFRQAIDVDPGFALAWSGYADCYSFLIMYVEPQESYLEEATRASERALELSSGLAEAHASRGLAHLSCKEFTQAEKEFDMALELNPGQYEAYYYYARTRFHQGDMDGAAEWFAKAAKVNPQDYQSRLLRVQILRGLGRIDEALKEAKLGIAVTEKHLEFNPDDARALHLGAGSLILLGEVERGKRWLQRAMDIDPDDSVVLYNLACYYSILGEIDKALDCLEKATHGGAVSTAWMKNDEDLAVLHGHPRFEKLLSLRDADD